MIFSKCAFNKRWLCQVRKAWTYSPFLIVWLSLHVSATEPTVKRVHPPNWWSLSKQQEITLLVEGTNLSTADVRAVPADVRGISEGLDGRALFIDLRIPAGTPPGKVALRLSFKDGRPAVEYQWELLAPPRYTPRAVDQTDVLYLVMPDRFANGDPSNDEPEGSERMLNRANPHAYHGGDFAGLRKRLPYLADLGVTAIWLTPVYRPGLRWYTVQAQGKQRRFADFHGYSPVDFYDTNPRFGSQAEYLALVQDAHHLGLKVIQDQIVGYVGPQHPWVTHPPAPDWFHGSVEKPPFCTFRYDALVNPHATEAERRGVTDGWFFGILPDLNTSNPQVRRYAIQQSLWWTLQFEADGVRLDTFPLVERSFWRDWWKALQAARPGIHVIGEAWVNDADQLCFFQGGRPGWDGIDPGVDMVFDFPLNLAIQSVFTGKSPASALSKTLSRDGLYHRPDLLVTFLDNHDTQRLATLPGATPARQCLAAAFLLTTRGIPQLTWGNELGLLGHMDDRHDFPGGFPGDARDAFTHEARTAEERSIFNAFRTLVQLRRNHPALQLGSLTNLVVEETSYAFLRIHEKERVVVALNLGDKPATLSIPRVAVSNATSATFAQLYGSGTVTHTDTTVTITLPAMSCGVFQLVH